MGRSVARKLIDVHLVDGDARPGSEIGLRIDQTLTQDATGTMVMLELEALGLERARTDVSVQYVDHNLLQADERNMADHLFLRSACQRFGLWFSRAGNGVSHPTHMQRFGVPGASMVGSDSHTCAAGSLGMLAIGVGGIEVAMEIAGEPVYLSMPEIWGVRLSGELPPWVSAKDVILEMLRRYGVRGGIRRIVEYHGPGLAGLSAMDRHVIANMGAELGATTTVFPADERVREFLRAEGREDDFVELAADPDADDQADEIDLAGLEPLIAAPSSPGNVTPVAEVAGEPVAQVVVGSSANPGFRDFAVVAAILRGQQAGPGTDPRKLPELLGIDAPTLEEPPPAGNAVLLEAPLPEEEARQVELVKAPSVGTLPDFDPLPDAIEAPVAIKVGDDISTDEIMPAGASALPFRSNIEKLSEFAFAGADPGYVERARQSEQHVIVGGSNYGQGSSREHAAIVPRHLGLRLVLAGSYARIHWQNLANFGVLPLEFVDEAGAEGIEAGDRLAVEGLHDALRDGNEITVHNRTRDRSIRTRHRLSPRQVAMVLAGGRIPQFRRPN
jgi:aconitase A